MTAAELDRAEAAIRAVARDRAEWVEACHKGGCRVLWRTVAIFHAAWSLPAAEDHLLAVIDEIRRHDAARRWRAEAESHWQDGLENQSL
jgi:hypothetical protein